jgi:hypothetical protein
LKGVTIGTLASAIVVLGGVFAGTGLWVWFRRARDTQERPPGSQPPEGQAAIAAKHPRNRWDLWVGLFGAIGGNLLLLFLLRGGWLSPLVGLQAFNGEALAAGLLNIGGLVVCAVTRPRIAVGMLIGDGITLVFGLAVAFFMIASAFGGLST